MAQRRIFFATQDVGIAATAAPTTFTAVRGLQSVGVSTQFNLSQIFEIGQLAVYEHVEDIPDVEAQLEKVLDGYPLIYHLATQAATAATLIGRGDQKCNLALNVYPDSTSLASGTPTTQCVMSGLYVSQVGYNLQIEGPFTENVTLVGNNRIWKTGTFTFSGNTGIASMSPSAPEGVNRRQNIIMTGCLFPRTIDGIGTDYINPYVSGSGCYGVAMQSIRISASLGRGDTKELGQKAPYFRYIQWPVEVSAAIEVISKRGDMVNATEAGAYGDGDNLTDEKLYVACQEGTKIDMGTKVRMTNVNYGGANAGANGANATATYNFVSYSDLTVTHPLDPTSALRA